MPRVVENYHLNWQTNYFDMVGVKALECYQRVILARYSLIALFRLLNHVNPKKNTCFEIALLLK